MEILDVIETWKSGDGDRDEVEFGEIGYELRQDDRSRDTRVW